MYSEGDIQAGSGASDACNNNFVFFLVKNF